MNELNRYATSRCFTASPCACFQCGFACKRFSEFGRKQTPPIPRFSGAIARSAGQRLGVTLGGEAWVDGGPLRKNLVINNPGFEAADYRAILRCAAVTPEGCQVPDAAAAQPGRILE